MTTSIAGEWKQEDVIITPKIRMALAERWKTFRTLTESKANARDGIEPIKIKFSAQYQGSDGQLQEEHYTEQCGIRLRGKGHAQENTKDITIIVGTHHNESAGFDAVRVLLDNWKSIRKYFPKNANVNILYGGEPQTTTAFFRELSHNYSDGSTLPQGMSRDKDGRTTITPRKLTDYRNTTKNENCNRIPRNAVPNIFNTTHTAPDDPDAIENRHLDFQGTVSWLKQKNEAFRKYYQASDIILDLHTLSRRGDPKPLIWFYDPKKEWIPEPDDEHATPGVNNLSKYPLLADMGAESLSIKDTQDAPTEYMASGGYEENQRAPHILFETGDHLGARSGEIAARALTTVVADHMGAPRIQIPPGMLYAWMVRNCFLLSAPKMPMIILSCLSQAVWKT